MWYFKAADIRHAHFEISNYCNAACPECPREDKNEIDLQTGKNRFDDWINTHFLSLDIIKKNFNKELTPSLKSVSFCGCFGDAITHPRLIDILEYIIDEFPKLIIYLHTNGGLKTTSYWTQLAETLKKSHYHEVVWGLDGLEDTNHLYRVNVNWSKVKANWQAFNNAGGNSHWQFIIFPHNHHQIDAARDYAKQEGFSAFKTVISMRYSETKAKELPLKYQHSKVTQEVNDQFKSTNYRPQLQTQVADKQSIGYNNIDELTNKIVKCDSQLRHNIFVFSEGTVWPCSQLGAWKNPDTYISAIIEKTHNARYNNSLHHYRIDSILDNSYFNAIENTHATGNFCKACVQQCGTINDQEVYQTRDQAMLEKL